MTATTFHRNSAHPSLASRTPSRTEDFFDEAQMAELRAYARPLKRVRLAARLVTLVVEAVLVFGLDLGPRVADLAEHQPWPVRLLVVLAVFGLVDAVVSVPVSYWSTLVHDRRHGLSNQSTGLWAVDELKGFVLGTLLTAALLTPVYLTIRELDSWWLVGGSAFLVLQLLLVFVYPILIMPRFNKFVPMEAGPVRGRIEQIADLAGVTIEGVYTMDGSKRSRRGNAFVAGFGPTTRVVVFDTIMDMPLGHLSQIVAHEIGHYRLRHIPKSFPLVAVQLLVALAVVELIGGSDTVLGWAGIDALGDPSSAPLFAGAFMIPMTVFGVVSAWWSRRNEREADLEALELLGSPTDFVAMWPGLVERNKADLEPGWWDRLNASHPEVAERMQFGLDWAALNGVEAERPAKAIVPSPGSTIG